MLVPASRELQDLWINLPAATSASRRQLRCNRRLKPTPMFVILVINMHRLALQNTLWYALHIALWDVDRALSAPPADKEY